MLKEQTKTGRIINSREASESQECSQTSNVAGFQNHVYVSGEKHLRNS